MTTQEESIILKEPPKRRKWLPFIEKGRAVLATTDELRNEWTFSPDMVPGTEYLLTEC